MISLSQIITAINIRILNDFLKHDKPITLTITSNIGQGKGVDCLDC